MNFTQKLSKTAFLFSLCILLAVFTACKKTNASAGWDSFAMQRDYFGIQSEHATIYTKNSDSKLYITLCANISGINCSIKLDHDCNAGQYENIKSTLQENGGIFKGKVTEPDTKNYPDLTDYLKLVMSSDEMHGLWQRLELE